MYKFSLLLLVLFFCIYVRPSQVDAQSQWPSSALPALTTNGGTLHSFSDAVNLSLQTDADYGRFVDPQVTGADRQLAIALLKYMPPNMRGDFVYVNSVGRVLSNRLGVGFSVQFLRRTQAASLRSTSRPIQRSRASMFRKPTPLSYPPTGGSGGAYIRTYSAQGINAAYGYAVPPCDISLQSNESGNMYFNAYNSSGSDIVDAGIGTNISAASDGNAVSVSFIYPGGGAGYLQTGWTNQSQQYTCGTPVGIMYGTLPSPNQQLSALVTGIPDYDPSQLDLPPATSTWQPAAWNFFPTNSALLQGATTWYGYPSNCAGCSIGQMVTIAQPGLSYDGSCYGYCSSAGADAYWYESVAGQLIAPCIQNSGSCTIADISSWVGGQNNSGAGIAYAPVNDQYVAEGLNLTGTFGNSNKSRRALSSSLPPAPTSACSLDSHGYCSKTINSSITGSCTRPPVVNDTVTTYYIFDKSKPSELLVSAVNTITHNNQDGCAPLSAWSPWDPAIHYKDSSLP